MRFEYVASAIAGLGKLHVTERNKPILENIIKSIPNNETQTVGLLFNAMVEASQGTKFSMLDIPSYSDSGGLQLAILGLDEEKVEVKKKEIFKTQSIHSDYAFIFDEMPIKMIPSTGDAKVGRVDNSGRCFIDELVLPSALKTAENVKQQIDHFISAGSDTKIFIIGQGRNFETFNRYMNTIVTHLNDDEIKHVRGIAPSDTCYGLGTLERWDLMYQIKNFDIPDEIKQNVHLLGVGSHTGFMPVFLSPSYFNFIDTLSFDSSSDTRKYAMDGFVAPGTRMEIDNPKQLTEEYHKIWEEIKPYLLYLGVKDETDFFENMTYLSSKNTEKIWSYFTKEEQYREATCVMYMHIISRFIKRVFNNIDHANEEAKLPEFQGEIRDYQDFLTYKKLLMAHFNLTSKKVRSVSDILSYNNLVNVKQAFSNLF